MAKKLTAEERRLRRCAKKLFAPLVATAVKAPKKGKK